MWNGRVVRSRSVRGYVNLKPIKTSDGVDQNQQIERLDDNAVHKLQIICNNRSKSILNCSAGEDKISIIKIPETADAVPVNLEGRPIICEVSAALNEHSDGERSVRMATQFVSKI